MIATHELRQQQQRQQQHVSCSVLALHLICKWVLQLLTWKSIWHARTHTHTHRGVCGFEGLGKSFPQLCRGGREREGNASDKKAVVNDATCAIYTNAHYHMYTRTHTHGGTVIWVWICFGPGTWRMCDGCFYAATLDQRVFFLFPASWKTVHSTE